MSRRHIRQPKSLNGESSLILAVICQALKDALNTRDRTNMLDAWSYLGSDRYKAHVTALGRPEEQQPEALANMDEDTYLRLTSVLLENEQ